MKRLLPIIVCFLCVSCTTSKFPLSGLCYDKQLTGGYNRINDSTFSMEMKEVGRTYLNFIIDSCQKINNTEINLTGYISFLDGNDRKMPGVDIFQADQIDRRMLKYINYLGKTDERGKFDIKVLAGKKDVFILLDKQNFNYTSVLLSF